MDVIDEKGRIFGLVNVIDAIVVLLVLAIVVAGVAFVLQPGPEPPAAPETGTVTATVDLGTQPQYIARRIAPGDSYAPSSNSNLTVTDVYVAPQGDTSRVLLTVDLTGVENGDRISYDGAPPRLGRSVTIKTPTYQVSGAIRGVGEPLTTGSTEVLLTKKVSSSTTAAIDVGDVYTLADRDVATVESVAVFGTANTNRRLVYLGLTIQTLRLGDGPQFGSTVVRPGARLPFRTDDYDITALVRRVGATELRGNPTTRSVTLEMRGVGPRTANNLRTGMSETIAGETIATITNVDIEPATVVLTSADGTIHVRQHPIERDVTITADLRIRETASGATFKGRTIRPGRTIALDLGTTTIEATVISIGR